MQLGEITRVSEMSYYISILSMLIDIYMTNIIIIINLKRLCFTINHHYNQQAILCISLLYYYNYTAPPSGKGSNYRIVKNEIIIL